MKKRALPEKKQVLPSSTSVEDVNEEKLTALFDEMWGTPFYRRDPAQIIERLELRAIRSGSTLDIEMLRFTIEVQAATKRMKGRKP